MDATTALTSYLERASFAKSEVDFCINPNGNSESSNRTDVRLVNGAYNASGVEVIARDEQREDGEGNRCNEENK